MLIEALTTMAISAFLIVALGSLVGVVFKASHRTAGTSEEIEEANRLLSTVISYVESISPQRWAGRSADFVFEGKHNRLVFARKQYGPDNRTEFHLLTLSSQPGLLVETDALLPPTAKGLADMVGGDLRMIKSRFQLRFAFFSRLPNGQEALTNDWSSSSTMPVAVRISLIDRQNRSWGAVRVRLVVDAEVGCAAPVVKTCSHVPGSPLLSIVNGSRQ